MDIFVPAAIATAWLAILAMLVWGLMNGWRKVMHDGNPLPFFAKLERRGLTVAHAEEAVGVYGLAAAVRRCALCPVKTACQAGRRVDCPNAALIARVSG